VTIKVLRKDSTEAGPGETGEIAAVGENVMLGYWKNPTGTAKALADGMLHTGDIGHIDDEGYVYITGRASEMIKSGEYRISPTEIEDVLYRHPGVHEAAVVGVEDPILGEVIVGLVVPKSGMDPSSSDLLSFCAGQLASYKRPKSIYVVAELPKSPNGKVLRQSLRELAKARRNL
jgi:acyl-CoA synthetase (AMP-forming)/AMP-acid ligase II